jgi:hypothetical protein
MKSIKMLLFISCSLLFWLAVEGYAAEEEEEDCKSKEGPNSPKQRHIYLNFFHPCAQNNKTAQNMVYSDTNMAFKLECPKWFSKFDLMQLACQSAAHLKHLDPV